MKSIEETVAEVVREDGINYKDQYETAVRWQEGEKERIAKQRREQLDMINRRIASAEFAFKRYRENMGQGSKARGQTGYLTEAMNYLVKALGAHMHLVHYEQPDFNPFLVPVDGPESPEEAEEPRPVNMEAPEPEEAPERPSTATYKADEATLVVDGARILFDDEAIEVLSKPVEASYGTPAMEDERAKARLRARVAEIQAREQEQLQKMMGPTVAEEEEEIQRLRARAFRRGQAKSVGFSVGQSARLAEDGTLTPEGPKVIDPVYLLRDEGLAQQIDREILDEIKRLAEHCPVEVRTAVDDIREAFNKHTNATGVGPTEPPIAVPLSPKSSYMVEVPEE